MGAMTTTLPPSIPPRVVEHEEPGETRHGTRLPPHTLRGAFAGIEAAIGSWLVVVVVAIAGYVATAAAPELGSAGWRDAAAIGSAVWLLGHGGTIVAGATAVTLVPLGVTALGVAAVATSMRRVHVTSVWPAVAAVLAYTAFAGVFAVFADVGGAWRGVIGAPVVALLGCMVTLRSQAPKDIATVLGRVPGAVRIGLAGGLRAAAGMLVLGLMAFLVALVIGFPRVMDVHGSLVPDGVSSVVIVVAQLVLVPTLVVWAAAFLAGPGFAVGQGTIFSPTGIEAGPLPVVPVLGALPDPESAAGGMGATVVLGVLVGVAVGWWLRRRAALPMLPTLAAVGVVAVTCALVMTALAAASSGSVGPGRMAVMGPEALAVGLAVGWQVLLGTALGALLRHPTTVAAVARVRAAVGDRAASDQD